MTEHLRSLRMLLIAVIGIGCVCLLVPSAVLAQQLAEGFDDPAHQQAYGDRAAIVDEINTLLKNEQFDEAFSLGDEMVAIERGLHGPNHRHVVRTLANLAKAGVRAKDPARASAYLAEVVELSATLPPELQATVAQEMDRACANFERRLLREKVYVAPGQLDRCGTAYHGDMMMLFNDQINGLVAEGRSAEARRRVEERFDQLELISGQEFESDLERAEEWTAALGITGTKAFELNLIEISDRMYRRARDFADQHLPDDNPMAATTKATLANRLDARGDHYSAQVLHREAWEVLVAAGQEHSMIGMAWANNYGRNQILLENFDRAVELFDHAQKVGSKELGNDDPTYLSILSSYVLALYRSGETALADEIVGEASRYVQRLMDDPDRFSPDDPYKKGLYFMLFLGNMGVAELDEAIRQADGRDTSRAQGLIDQAHEGLVRLVGQDDDLSVAFAINRANGLIESRTDIELAQSLAREAFEIWELRQSRFGLREQDFDNQKESKALSRFFGFTMLDAHAVASTPLEQQAPNDVVFRAMQWLGRGDASAAVAREFAINAAQREGEDLKQMVVRREQISERWVQNETRIRESYSSLDDDILDVREALTAENAALEAEFDEIDARITEKFPAYYSMTRGQPLDRQAARSLMRRDEAALVIAPTGRGTHIALVTADKVSWTHSQLSLAELGRMVRRLKWYLGSEVSFEPDDDLSFLDQVKDQGPMPFDFETAHLLYNQLIAPFEGELEDKTHLFVAAAGPIGSLPLGVLVSELPTGPPGETETLKNAAWFADEIAIVKIASLQALDFQRRFRAQQSENELDAFLGFGAPELEGEAKSRGGLNRAAGVQKSLAASSVEFNGVDVNGKPLIDRQTLLSLARLPGTARELNAISALFGTNKSSVRLGAEATEANFKSSTFDGVDVLVLATHGLVAGELAGLAEPGLVLTPPDVAQAAEDGFLAASEIVGLRIAVDWVILSACNTAAGDGSEESSALSGLARSFLFAGARNLLVSHWPVGDAVAPELTVRTIELLRGDPTMSRAQAFQQAMREVRNASGDQAQELNWAHPNAWAPFSLVGDR